MFLITWYSVVLSVCCKTNTSSKTKGPAVKFENYRVKRSPIYFFVVEFLKVFNMLTWYETPKEGYGI